MITVSRKHIRAWDAALIAAFTLALAGLAASGIRSQSTALAVWSCGGNYEVLCAYIPAFEAKHGVRVRYTAAPVQYLLEAATRSEGKPDVIVGRSGPGWLLLREKGLILESDPLFFAVDPMVVAVAPEATGKVTSLADVGDDGVRVVASPDAMRPKGKVIALFMAHADATYPGLVERWTNNAASTPKCGRHLLEPLFVGKADASVCPSSLATYTRGSESLTKIPIDPKLLTSMGQGRPSMPQCAAPLTTSRQPDLARAFVEGLASADTASILEAKGYIPVGSSSIEPFRPMLVIQQNKDMAGWQVRLAQLLHEYGAEPSSVRRYLMAMEIFGPSAHDGRILCELGDNLLVAGDTEGARRMWSRALIVLPRPTPNEFTGPAAEMGAPVPNVDRQDDEYWRDLAAQRLAGNHMEPLTDKWWVTVEEADPPKNGKRNGAVGRDLSVLGHRINAMRDYLKVVTLNHPSSYAEEAEPGVARLMREEGLSGPLAADPPMPPWEQRFDTDPERGMSYGMRLWEAGVAENCYKEMVKLCSGEYGPSNFTAEARYRAGVAGKAIGRPAAAARQWRICCELHPESPWAALARAALETLPAKALKSGPPLPEADEVAEGQPKVRLRIADELWESGFQADDMTLLEYLKVSTVAAPPAGEGIPVSSKANFRVAECLRARGRPHQALVRYQEVVEKWPDTPWAARAREAIQAMILGEEER